MERNTKRDPQHTLEFRREVVYNFFHRPVGESAEAASKRLGIKIATMYSWDKRLQDKVIRPARISLTKNIRKSPEVPETGNVATPASTPAEIQSPTPAVNTPLPAVETPLSSGSVLRTIYSPEFKELVVSEMTDDSITSAIDVATKYDLNPGTVRQWFRLARKSAQKAYDKHTKAATRESQLVRKHPVSTKTSATSPEASEDMVKIKQQLDNALRAIGKLYLESMDKS